jgi:hypothetical protein
LEYNIKEDLQSVWRTWIRVIRLRAVVGCCAHGNEPSGSVPCGEFD